MTRKPPKPQDDASGPKLPTPELDDSPLDLPPPDAIVALQLFGEGSELRLSPQQQNFALGSAPPPAVDVWLSGKKYVSEKHAFLSRRGNTLTITDNRSRNGTFFAGYRDTYGEVKAGQTFRVADVKLLALDERLRQLRKLLRWWLGYEAHAQLDQAVIDVADEESPGLLLLGPPDCDPRQLAEMIHRHSARRNARLVVAEPPLRSRAEEVALLKSARGGTVFVDLDDVRPMQFFATHLFSATYRVRPIVAARTRKQVEDALGVGPIADQARALRSISIPPLADRRDDIPALLDELLTHEQCPHSIRQIGEGNLAALVTAHKWKANLRDLREVARRCRALLEEPTQAEAAARLGITPSTLSEWLSSLGMKWPPADRPRAQTA